jgi:inhibitor of KinA
MELRILGDHAVLAYLSSDAAAVQFAHAVRAANPPWLHDVVPAYASVGVFFDSQVTPSAVREWLTANVRLRKAPKTAARQHVIPVCYELQLDLARVAELVNLSTDEVIAKHVGTTYRIYAIGFVPGFPYLGYLPAELCGVPRLASPRVRVEPGSVGLTGKQTGVYPLARPGGWNLIGRTPLTLVDVADQYFPLRVGDLVSFLRIDDAEYRRRDGERLV